MPLGNGPAFAHIARNIGHELGGAARDAGGDLRGGVHDEVPQGAGDGDVLRAERHAHALLGVVVVVDRVVAPERAVSVGCGATRLGWLRQRSAVVPDVVVGVGAVVFHAPNSTQGDGHRLS